MLGQSFIAGSYSNPRQFSVVRYTGNGTSQAVSGVGFLSDLTIISARDSASNRLVFDSTRGAQIKLELPPISGNATDANSLVSFNTSGFNVGSAQECNLSGTSFVAWNWKEKAEFLDIITYTGDGVAGRTVPHGLGVAPKMVIIKRTDANSSFLGWATYHVGKGNTHSVYLNSAGAPSSSTGYWNNTTPGASTITVGNDNDTNKLGASYIGYLFAERNRISSFGTYTGNGTSTGPVVNIGFSPKMVLVKAVGPSGEGTWSCFDTVRGNNARLAMSLTVVEDTIGFEFNSSGFQPKSSDTTVNRNGETFIYAAWR